MAPPKLNKVCEIDGCGRKHAANGMCLMHYKRVQRHGSTEYRWGGKIVGRACQHCDRPVIAQEMCWRHYQMWRNHGDALYADVRKVDGLPPGVHARPDREHLRVSPVAEITTARPMTDPALTRQSKPYAAAAEQTHGLRDGSRRTRSEWLHRKVADAKPGEVVHHIDGDPRNNTRENLHLFSSPAAHARAHRSLERVAYDLLQRGLVSFDPDEGIYRLLPDGDRSR